MENLLLGLLALNTLLVLLMAWRLRPYLLPRRIEVFLNGQHMREGLENDFLMKDGVPEFDFRLKHRGGSQPDVVEIRHVPRYPTTILTAKRHVEMKEDESGEPYEVETTVLEAA